jgi:membrane protein implicated in regulation of membrane protease activity
LAGFARLFFLIVHLTPKSASSNVFLQTAIERDPDMLFYMQILSFPLALIALLTAVYAYARIEKQHKATEDLDWEAIAALTGDVGVVKRAIQKVNNRINGMERGEGVEAQAMQLLLQSQQQQTPPSNNNGYTGG